MVSGPQLHPSRMTEGVYPPEQCGEGTPVMENRSSCREVWSGSFARGRCSNKWQVLGDKGHLWEDSQASAGKEMNKDKCFQVHRQSLGRELDQSRSQHWIQKDEAPFEGKKATGRKGEVAGVQRPHLRPCIDSLFQEFLHSRCFVFRLQTLTLTPSLSHTHLRPGFPHVSSARRSTDLLSHLKATPLSSYSISVLNATTMPISWVENLSMISDWASGHLPDQLASWPRTSLLAFPDPLGQT